jgi:hypothetical protein
MSADPVKRLDIAGIAAAREPLNVRHPSWPSVGACLPRARWSGAHGVGNASTRPRNAPSSPGGRSREASMFSDPASLARRSVENRMPASTASMSRLISIKACGVTRGRVIELSTSLARPMIRRKGNGNALRRLLSVAAACLVLVGLTPSVQASASEDPAGLAESLVLSAVGPNVEAHSHPGTGHDGPGHCLSSSGCTSAAVLPEAAVLPIGKQAPTLIRADVSPYRWDTLPPLHPPNSANLG